MAWTASHAAHAQSGERSIRGTVFADLDLNGVFSAGDQGVAGAAVFWESSRAVLTDANGEYTLTAPAVAGLVWVRVPDGFRPGPVWQSIAASGAAAADLALVPGEHDGPLTFVVASDTHIGIDALDPDALRSALEQATDLVPEPWFIAVTGDITQGNQPDQFQDVLEASAGISTPYVPIPGNHDWYDGGDAYRQYFGPPNYSFEAGGVHFVVLNDQQPEDTRRTFLDLDLATITGDPVVVAFIHAPPEAIALADIESAGVDYLFSGHLHSNRVLVHDTLLEYNTQPMIMGGIDMTPGGYRVVSLVDDGAGPRLELYHRTTVAEPVVTISYPRPSEAVAPCDIDVIAAVEHGGGTPRVSVSIAGSEPVMLERVGGWNYRGRVGNVCEPGLHDATIEVETDTGQTVSAVTQVCVAGAPAVPEAAPVDWPELQGNSLHQGLASQEITPPVRTVWAYSVGQNLYGSSPVLAEGRLFVPISDLGDGSAGGLAALDARTGQELWVHRSGFGVRGAPAVSGGLVVIAVTSGSVQALDAATGELRWTYQLGAAEPPLFTSLHASPTIVDALVYVGIQRDFVALDLATGEPVWSTIPSSTEGAWSTTAAAAVDSGVAVSSVAIGKLGLLAWDAGTGALLWQTSREPTIGLLASPLIADGTVYTLNWATHMHAIDLFTGEIHWSRQVAEDSFEWGFGAPVTPAYADGMLYVPTTHGRVVAIDAMSGVERWSHAARPSAIYLAHYQGVTRSFVSSPVVTGSLVWMGGGDGTLSALDRVSGDVVWEDDLGSPITMGLVPSGAMLYVATYDGVIRAMRAASDFEDLLDLEALGCPDTVVPAPASDAGCGCGSAGSTGALGSGALLLLAMFVLTRRQRPPVQ